MVFSTSRGPGSFASNSKRCSIVFLCAQLAEMCLHEQYAPWNTIGLHITGLQGALHALQARRRKADMLVAYITADWGSDEAMPCLHEGAFSASHARGLWRSERRQPLQQGFYTI